VWLTGALPVSFSPCPDSCVLVHDITDSKSFDNLESWMGQQRNNTSDTVLGLVTRERADSLRSPLAITALFR